MGYRMKIGYIQYANNKPIYPKGESLTSPYIWPPAMGVAKLKAATTEMPATGTGI